ncbi:hypothetical protein BCIN_15g00890 [Botrytis cinerea B05.10]|uniref:Cytochrome p450 protein n=1 Tax=Botryotinia fuckeliana (strain B05.10) TaxID=332648 RepID=A0A384K4E4_BOTFB|nr:hypothetical protein BCIN_15g00890 [Botrytis cinerea B05.10]ATZ57514.1 hypothetical protein BCIN_15g00890 [Botrytis cinerea B05.10]
MMDGFHKFGPLAVQLSWFIPMINIIPTISRQIMNPGGNKFVEFKQELLTNVDKASRARAVSHQEEKNAKTLFDEINASKLPEIEKQRSRLLDEARNMAISGTETTSLDLSKNLSQKLTFHLLSNPNVLIRPRAELKTTLLDPSTEPILKDMEQLPYLSALIQEVLRIAMGTSNRQTRNAPDQIMKFDDGKKVWLIPAGTNVGMTAPLIHLKQKKKNSTTLSSAT